MSSSINPQQGSKRASVGLAWSPYVNALLDRHPGAVDYIEVAYEQLCRQPVQAPVPLILHCSSLSVAGDVAPSADTIRNVQSQIQATATPWLGEHLSYILADALQATDGAPTNVGYTVCPQLSDAVVDQVVRNVTALRQQLSVPIIVENPPQYFRVPGSHYELPAFIAEVAQRADIGLLLDLCHFYVAAHNSDFDAFAALQHLPLQRVVEIHISGMSLQSGVMWDNHAEPAPEIVFELLDEVLQRARPQAVTFEYNWAPDFSDALLLEHIARVRTALDRTEVAA